MTATFRHDERGTSAADWQHVLRNEALPTLSLPDRRGRLVVLAAHPDDETLGVGGLMYELSANGWEVVLVCASDGEASHPSSPTHTPAQLAERRRHELSRAADLLAPGSRVTHLGLPDGGLADHVETIVNECVAIVGTHGAQTVVCAPWRHDAHPDHEAVGRAAALVAHRTDARLIEYPIWFWHWGSAAEAPYGLRRVDLPTRAQQAKAEAIRAHTSQVEALSPADGDEVLLTPAFLEHFAQPCEYVVDAPPTPDSALDELHQENPDPWNVDSWYERRKRAITLAALPRERYRRALEVGCSVGALARDLSERTDALVAIDSSRTAVALATERLADVANTVVRQAAIPYDWPAGTFDLVCISEVGYFLSPRQLAQTASRALTCLAPGGHLVLCHWQPKPEGWPLAGPEVHDRFLRWVSEAAGRVVASYAEDSFLLHVFEMAS